jgi:fatty acid desaturase
MTRQQDADAMLRAEWAARDVAARLAIRRRNARNLRDGKIWDAVACALVFGGIGAAFLIPWGAL